MLLNKIKEKSIDELKELHKKFNDNEIELGIVPFDLHSLKASIKLWETLNA